MTDVEAEITDQQLASRGMQEILNDKSKTFDLLLLETAGISPFHALADHFGVPVVGITSADAHTIVHEAIGNPANAVTHPDRVLPFVTAKSFAQRLGSFTFTLLMKFIITPRNERKQIELLEKHFPNVKKSPAELIRNVDLQFTNTHPALGFIRPLLPSTIQLGFLHVKPPMSLPDDLLQLVEKSKHGVIFMSFGTIVTSKLAMKNFGSFLRAFADLEFDVLWKYDGEIPAAVPSNVHFRKWFPQSDLLAHPKVKLFITQGVSEIQKQFNFNLYLTISQGLHSIEESITRRVPMLICPFHGDQGANAERSAERGISKSLNIHEELDSNHIKSAINGMITDSR